MFKNDSLGNRIKKLYETPSKIFLSGRNYTIIRIDGKAFHTYTRGLGRPFDMQLLDDMNETAKFLCKEIQNAKFAFVQSDEISILLTDFDKITTSAWFDNNLQKMSSVSSSYATGKFNSLRPGKLAFFDSRIFQISERTEVENYFIWRQQDTTRNSISSVAQSLYSAKQLHGVNTGKMQDMIFDKGINWNDYSSHLKRGRLIIKSHYEKSGVMRSEWVVAENTQIFTQQRNQLQSLIPERP